MAGGIVGPQSTSSESNFVLQDNFEGTTTAITIGTEFVEGKQGKGILIDSTDTADYNQNLNLQKGTIEYWIKPKWNPNTDPNDRKIIFIGDLTNGLIITGKADSSLWGADTGTYLEIFVNGKSHIAVIGIGANGQNWKENEWHHVKWTWDGETGEMYAYADNVLVDSKKYEPFAINIPSNRLQLGYAWGKAIDAVVDELKITDTVKTDEPLPTKTIEGDLLGDACDPDDDNDNILDENDDCPETNPTSPLITENGCSCEQVKEAVVSRGKGYARGVLSNKNLGICRAAELGAKGILAKTGKAFALEISTALSSPILFILILLIGLGLAYIYIVLKKKK